MPTPTTIGRAGDQPTACRYPALGSGVTIGRFYSREFVSSVTIGRFYSREFVSSVTIGRFYSREGGRVL